MKHCTHIPDEYIIPSDRFENVDYIDQRVSAVDNQDQRKFRSLLEYLYLLSGPVNLIKDKRYLINKYLEPAEIIIANWMKTRTNGSLRAKYGNKALIQAKKAKYQCEGCGFPDVRALNIDHVNGKDDKDEFKCLCANCHSIKSRESDWKGI